MYKELFPLRIATGKRFCNRVAERKLLKECIKQKRPTVLISPRRYGKSSLAHKVTQELKYPFCEIDFLTAYDDDSLCLHINKSISELISTIMPINMKTVEVLEKCFSGIKAALKYKFIELEFSSSIMQQNPIQKILDTLRGLDKLAHKLNKTVVLFMDEFQRLLELEKGEAIQGAIRSVAQTTNNIAFLFSGSSRHMLTEAFDSPNQPLYMMCEKMFLERISAHDYIPYIQTAAKIRWSQQLKQSVVDHIIYLSEEHPFYINYLCGKLWQKDVPPNDQRAVNTSWRECLIGEERRLTEELDKLTIKQRYILQAIAQTANLKEPTATVFLTKVKMSSGTVIPILKALKKKDMIYTDTNNNIRVLDPLMRYMLAF